MSPPSIGTTFAGIGAPEIFLLDPAVEAFADQTAPFAVAGLQRADHASLQAGRHIGIGVAGAAQGEFSALLPGRDDSRASTGQERMQHPAFGAVGVADTPPDVEFGRNFDRQTGALENPDRAVVLRWSFAQVDAVGLQADEARHRQARDRAGLLRGLARPAAQKQRKQGQNGAQAPASSAPRSPFRDASHVATPVRARRSAFLSLSSHLLGSVEPPLRALETLSSKRR